MIVAFTDEAEADLERIGDFIAQDNPRRAVTFVTELIEICERLADAPEGYPLVPRYRRSGVRRRAYGISNLLPRHSRPHRRAARPQRCPGLRTDPVPEGLSGARQTEHGEGRPVAGGGPQPFTVIAIPGCTVPAP